MKRPFHGSMAAGLIPLVLSACGAALTTTDREVLSASDAVMVNGKIVPATGADDLLTLLRREFTARQLGQNAHWPEYEPVVVLDGVRLDGVHRLADVRAADAASVRRLRGPEAVVQYGRDARWGAIVVTTRRGGHRDAVASLHRGERSRATSSSARSTSLSGDASGRPFARRVPSFER